MNSKWICYKLINHFGFYRAFLPLFICYGIHAFIGLSIILSLEESQVDVDTELSTETRFEAFTLFVVLSAVIILIPWYGAKVFNFIFDTANSNEIISKIPLTPIELFKPVNEALFKQIETLPLKLTYSINRVIHELITTHPTITSILHTIDSKEALTDINSPFIKFLTAIALEAHLCNDVQYRDILIRFGAAIFHYGSCIAINEAPYPLYTNGHAMMKAIKIFKEMYDLN